MIAFFLLIPIFSLAWSSKVHAEPPLAKLEIIRADDTLKNRKPPKGFLDFFH